MTRSACLASLVLALAAPVTRGQSAVPTLPGYPAVGEMTTVTVTSTGAAPRRPLRYAVPAGYRSHMNMDMTMSIAMGAGEQRMPPVNVPTVRIGADTAVTSVTPDGDMTFTIAFTGMNFQSTAGMDAAALAPFEAMSSQFRNIRGTATISSRGVTRDLQMDTSGVSNPQLSQMMGSVKNSLSGLSMPLPEEPVGVGARWEVRQAMGSSGVTLFQKVGCELAAVDDRSATIAVTIDQTAPAQTMQNPSLPSGTAVSIESIAGSGNGTMKLAFDSLVPTSEMTSKSTMVMTMKAGAAAAQHMTVETSLKLAVGASRE